MENHAPTGIPGRTNATSTVAFVWGSSKDQRWPFVGLSALGGVMNDPTGTTTCFGFLGFFASLLLRNWPFAMGVSLQ
ncbi:MAG: hypothetical protein LT080_10055 [Thiobacillus sp.]|nr:hypothetical protein [Thiobacillus sp.]